jgi:hypothetical protein
MKIRAVLLSKCLALVVLFVSHQLAGVSLAADEQLWATMNLSKPHSETVYYELNIEPKLQYFGDPRWWTLDATPILEYYVNPWLTLQGEVKLGYAHQANEVDTYLITPRVGFKLHLFKYARDQLKPERTPLKRLKFGNLLRLEYKNLYYSDDDPSSHEWRLRSRLEVQFPLNHKHIADDRTLYAATDGEIFIDLSSDPEVYLSKIRARIGLGYRLDYQWRFEILYIRDWDRDAAGDPFTIDQNAWDFVLRRFF